MGVGFLDLPLELRLEVYFATFGVNTVILSGGRQDSGDNASNPALFPANAVHLNSQGCSAQLLRTCKAILDEARPILYNRTHFKTITEAFAGRLPTHFTTSHPTARQVRSLTWQLDCDLLKKLYLEDIQLDQADFPNLKMLELRCRTETGTGSFCDKSYDEKRFTRERLQIIDYAKILQQKMTSSISPVKIVEQQKSYGRRGVVLRLVQASERLKADELEVA